MNQQHNQHADGDKENYQTNDPSHFHGCLHLPGIWQALFLILSYAMTHEM
jgi:hypothetical protein